MFDIIYADPPWQYDFSKDSKDKIENHYNTMKLKDICDLKIPSNKNSVLYLWATAPKLLEAIEVMKSWDFKYKTHCIWDKKWIGMGYWFRGQHELLLIGTKGKFSPPTSAFRKSSIYQEKRTEHSKKPIYFKELITESFKEYSKIELFSRENEKELNGWINVGNHISGNSIQYDLELIKENKYI